MQWERRMDGLLQKQNMCAIKQSKQLRPLQVFFRAVYYSMGGENLSRSKLTSNSPVVCSIS